MLASMWFPSAFTFPLQLPALPSIPLPANIQRRFLSYVLKRALGRFVIASGLDVGRIQAQISQGWVELERLEIDAAEINTLIPEGLPFTVTSGEVAKVSARVPFPNLWSDPLSLDVDSLTLDISIAAPGKGKSPSSAPRYQPTSPLHTHLDLAGSVTSAADDFVHDELDAFEGAELDRSIRESLILSQTDPFARDDVPGAFPGFGATPSRRRTSGGSQGSAPQSPSAVESSTVLATLVERILARLSVRVKNVKLRIRYEDEERGGIFELRIAEVRYATEIPEQPSPGPRKTVRTITISSVGLYLIPVEKPRPTPPRQRTAAGTSMFASGAASRGFPVHRTLSRSMSASSSSSVDSALTQSTDSSSDEFHDMDSMVMSQAVADLRTSEAPGASRGFNLRHSTIPDLPDMAESIDSLESIPDIDSPPPRNAGLQSRDPQRLHSESPPAPNMRASTMTQASGRSLYQSAYQSTYGSAYQSAQASTYESAQGSTYESAYGSTFQSAYGEPQELDSPSSPRTPTVASHPSPADIALPASTATLQPQPAEVPLPASTVLAEPKDIPLPASTFLAEPQDIPLPESTVLQKAPQDIALPESTYVEQRTPAAIPLPESTYSLGSVPDLDDPFMDQPDSPPMGPREATPEPPREATPTPPQIPSPPPQPAFARRQLPPSPFSAPSPPLALSPPREPTPPPREATPVARAPTPPARQPAPPRHQPTPPAKLTAAPKRQPLAASFASPGLSRSATPTGFKKPTETLLLSFGSEDIVVRMITTQAYVEPTSPTTAAAASASAQQLSSLPAAFELELSFGTIAAVILPDDAALILATAQAAVAGQSGVHEPENSPRKEVIPQPRFEARVQVKGIYMAMIYDCNRPTEEFYKSTQQFFVRPASLYLPIGHLRLRLEDLGIHYTAPPVIPDRQRKRPDLQRKATTNAAKIPTITLTVGDASLFEYLASAATDPDEPPGGAFPVLIFDAGLPKQYEVPPGAPSSLSSSAPRTPANLSTFPEFDSVDWRNSGAGRKGGEKAWRVRTKGQGRGILRGAGASPEPPAGPAIVIRKVLSDRDAATVDMLPIHLFLDLSLVERLLPLLRSLAPIVQSSGDSVPTPTTSHPSVRPMMALNAHTMIDGLEAASRQARDAAQQPRVLITVRCPMIRLDIRCPAPLNRRGSWGDGAHLRSGIVTLDIHGVKTSMAQDPPPHPPSLLRRPSQGAFEQPPAKGGIYLEWQKMVFLFSRVPEKRSSAFLVIGPLAPDPGDPDVLLLPSVHVHSEVAPHTGRKTQSVTCKIPCVQAKIRQTAVEGLQFFADDMTHWLDGAFGDGSAPKPRDDLKMIGSRFFGSKASSSASSSAVDDEDDDMAATLLRLLISETEVVLLVPKSNSDEERLLSLHASDLDVKLESNTMNKQETAITVSAMDADLFHRADAAADAGRLFGRTTPLTLTTHTQPLFQLRFSSLTHADRTKETGIRLSANACSVFVTKDLDWVHDLKRYAKTPEGVFEDVVPSEVTRIQVSLNDCSTHISAPSMPGALLAVANVLEVRTVMESDADDSTVDIGLSGIHLLAIDDLAAATPLQMGYTMSIDAWKRAGYAQLLELSTMDAQFLRSLVPQETMLVDVGQANVKVTACADSLATFGALAGDLAKLAPAKPAPKAPPKRQMTLDQTIDVFASVDLQAFGKAPELAEAADMIEDDLPTNLDYLDHTVRQSMSNVGPIQSPSGESLRSWETTDDAPHINEAPGGTAKILMTEPFIDEPYYWDNLPVLKNGEETRMGRSRVRVQNCSVSVFLHDGYDWVKTRKAIEDEIKAVRRRLEKIKQLLASGQKADASVDLSSSVLFNSIYIGLDGRDDMDSTQLLAAIDEELEDLGAADTSSQSSWQSIPDAAGVGPAGARAAAAAKKSHVRLHGKRLTRSKRGQLEFSFHGIRADIDVYAPDDATAQRVHVTAQSFEILDHIKTSTWKKFLTEMKADARGNVRETDADMVRLELLTVRPNLPSMDEEIRVRAKILPLRLHVDQDALDFLKSFFSFSAPGTTTPVEEAPKQEPFFQHVEIFPVELKLDYKPKRVDYAALRQGKTIELMNFFHFDGAEMTLRHVTLSGITGSTKLSNMLQDIWTPDVKANQLADVISGVSPIRSMVNVGSGVADLILLPIEQYRKDGRLARGVQRGTNSFVHSTAMEMMKLGAQLATGTQVVLERAEGVLGPKMGDSVILEATGPPGRSSGAGDSSDEEDEAQSRYANQPDNVQDGVRAAYKSLSNNFNSAAQTILAVPMEVYERSSDDGPLKAVVRAVPIAVLKPMIGASEAVSKTLWGLRNTLDPEGRRELGDKYK